MATGSFPNCAPGLNTHNQKKNNKIPSFQLKPPHAFSSGLQEQRWWQHWVMATGPKHLCRGNPMPPLARTQKTQCHVVAGGHHKPDVLLLFSWMSSTHGVKEEGDNIFYLSNFLLPHIHNENSWRLYVLIKPDRSKNTKHRGNTKGRLSKRERNEGTNQGKSPNLVPDE